MEIAGVTPSSTQRQALTTLIRDIDANIGLAKFDAIYPMLGGSAATHALDLMLAQDITWSGTVTHNANGSTSNGTTGYGTLDFDATLLPSNWHMGVYINKLGTVGAQMIGWQAVFGDTDVRSVLAGTGFHQVYNGRWSGTNDRVSVASDGDGMIIGIRNSNTDLVLFREGVEAGTYASAQSATAGSGDAQTMKLTGAGTGYCDSTLAFASIGDNLSDTEATALSTAVTAYQTALNRDISRVGAYITKVIAAGGTLTQTEKDAIVTLDAVIESIGASKFHAFYPFAGGVAAAHAIDLMGAFDITWNGTITHNSSGVKGNGSTGYGNTGYNPSLQSSTTDAHMGFYAADGTHIASSSSAMGAGGGGAGFPSMFTHGWFNGGTEEIFAFNIANGTEYTPATGGTKHDGHLMAGVTTGSVQQTWYDGVAQTAGPTATGAGNYYNGNLYICARNDSGASAFDDRILKAVHVGDYLTSGEVTTLYNAITAYQTALGREDV